jgi:hypothetical protein
MSATFELVGTVEYVRIPVDTSEVHRPATDEDREKYATAYRAFKSAPVTRAEAAAVVAAEPPPPEFMKGFVEPEPPKEEEPKPKSFFTKKHK